MSVSILVVDDEPDAADLFRQRFRREARQGTVVMHFAASGAEALNRLAEEIQPRLAAVLSDKIPHGLMSRSHKCRAEI
jgi:CheY-like chemotaxis protein